MLWMGIGLAEPAVIYWHPFRRNAVNNKNIPPPQYPSRAIVPSTPLR